MISNTEIKSVKEVKEKQSAEIFEKGKIFLKNLEVEKAINCFEESLMFDNKKEEVYYYLATCYSKHSLFFNQDIDKVNTYLKKRAEILGSYDADYFKFHIDLEYEKILTFQVESIGKFKMLKEKLFQLLIDFERILGIEHYFSEDLEDWKQIEHNCELYYQIIDYASDIIDNFSKKYLDYIESSDESIKNKLNLYALNSQLGFCYNQYAEYYIWKEVDYEKALYWSKKALGLSRNKLICDSFATASVNISNRDEAIEGFCISLYRGIQLELYKVLLKRFSDNNLINDIVKECRVYDYPDRLYWFFFTYVEVNGTNSSSAKIDLIKIYEELNLADIEYNEKHNVINWHSKSDRVLTIIKELNS